MTPVFTGNYMKCNSVEMDISGIVITHNEENNIRECLESIKWLNEIVIVDSQSKDNTLKIASEYTDKIFSVDISNVTEKRKYALDKAKFEWVIFIDADERVTRELKQEILSLKSDEIRDINGFYINRKNYYFGKWIRHCGLYPDYHLRLFRKDKAKITDRIVHEAVIVNGTTRKLDNDMLHYSSKDLTQMIDKVNYYSTLEALEHFQNKKIITKTGVFTHAVSAFLRVFISRKGYKDKINGFFVSLNDALVNFLTHLKLLKLQGKL
jgi:glycosyltransferase involved in cell wall biosynthesis